MNAVRSQQTLDQTLRWKDMKAELVKVIVFSSYLRRKDQLLVLGEARANDDGSRGYREGVNKVFEEDCEHAILVPHICLHEAATLSSLFLREVVSAFHDSLQVRCLDHALTVAVIYLW